MPDDCSTQPPRGATARIASATPRNPSAAPSMASRKRVIDMAAMVGLTGRIGDHPDAARNSAFLPSKA
nr:hypothetical protein Aca09nite_44110 [Actinoplanes campanulatus]